jgi:integrase
LKSVANRGDGIRQRTLTRKRADGTIYEIERYVADVDLGIDPLTGKRIRESISGTTRSEVERKRRALLGQRDKGARPTSRGRYSVETWLRHWLDTVIAADKNPATFRSYDQTARTHIFGTVLGKKSLAGRGKVEPVDVEVWKAALSAKGLAPSTRRRCLTVLRKAFQHAFRQSYMDRNVASTDFVDGVSVPKRDIRPLSQPQVQRLLAQAASDQDTDYAMYVLAFVTGMRQGELLGLRWATDETEAGLDLERSVVRVYEQLQLGTLGRRLKRESLRELVLDAEVLDVMRAHRTTVLTMQLKAGKKWREHGLVFPTRVGTPQRPANAWLAWKRLLKRAGLPIDARFHDQRATAASLAIADGASLFNVSKMLGHRDIRTTANQYGHLMDEGRTEMAERMSRIVLGK